MPAERSAGTPAKTPPAAPGLSGEEVARVLRRAADLDAQATEAAQAALSDQAGYGLSRFDPATVEQAAAEAGLSREAVHQALAELHAESGVARPSSLVANIKRRPEARLARNQAAEARLVTTPPDLVHTTVDAYLRRQMFRLRRRQAQWAVYRRRRDLNARMRRATDLNGRLRLGGVRTVTVSVLPVNPSGPAPALEAPASAPAEQGEPFHMVRLEAELSSRRKGAQVRTVGTGIATGSTVAIGGVLLLPELLLPALAGVASGVGAGFWLGRRLLRRRRDEVSEVLGSLLDRLPPT